MPIGVSWHAVVLLFGLLAFAPTRLGDLSSHPDPVATYAAAIERIATVQRAEDSVVAAGGGSILLSHGHATPRVVVLFHGLTDSPTQFLPFAQQLYAEGANVYVPRLPHHAERAGNVAAMKRLTAQELRDVGDASTDAARGLGDTVIAAWIGQYRPEVRRVVLVAPALEVTHVPSMLHGAVLRIALRVPNVTRASPHDSAAPDREPGWATHAVAQTLKLGVAVRNAAGDRAPQAREMSFLLNAHDHTVAAGASLDLAREWRRHGDAVVRVFELPDSLELPHDVVDPRHPGSNPRMVFPVLDALVSGKTPVSWVTELPTR